MEIGISLRYIQRSNMKFIIVVFLLCVSISSFECALTARSGSLRASTSRSEESKRTKGKEVWHNRNEKSILRHALDEGVGGGLAGLVQVLTMMWLRTTVNYQYRYGVSLQVALLELYKQGGIPRFYKGLPFAMVQGPLCKFGAVASNEGAKKLVHDIKFLGRHPSRILIASLIGSIFNVLWRLVIMPLDTVKTILQVDGLSGFDAIKRRVIEDRDMKILFRGSKATILATFIGHSWFLAHNWLEIVWPHRNSTRGRFLRTASIGFLSSAFSDTLSNSIRVVKTMKQAALNADGKSANMSYRAIIAKLIEEKGYLELFGRGLSTRILSNGLQSVLFTIVWQAIRRLKGSVNRAIHAVTALGLLETPDLNLAGEVLANDGHFRDTHDDPGDSATDPMMLESLSSGNFEDSAGSDYEYNQYMNMDAFGTNTDAAFFDSKDTTLPDSSPGS